MFGRGFFEDFNSDPFFSGFNNHFNQIDAMFNGGRDEFPALPAGRSHNRRYQEYEANQQQREIQPFGADLGFGSIFGGMGQMFNEMNRMMEHSRNDPNAFSYSQSSVMTFSNDGDGQPKVYQATSSTKKAGGIKETHKAVKDSTHGIQRMEVGQHIGGRSRVVERDIDMRTGQRNERTEYNGFREEEAESFDNEWRQFTLPGALSQRFLETNEDSSQPAITDGNQQRHGKKSKKSKKTSYYVEEA